MVGFLKSGVTMQILLFTLLLTLVSGGTYAQPVDQVIVQLERQYQAKVISVQERRGGLKVRLLQNNGVVKTINYQPEGWRPPRQPRIGVKPSPGSDGQDRFDRGPRQ
jgi:hypothetical protein